MRGHRSRRSVIAAALEASVVAALCAAASCGPGGPGSGGSGGAAGVGGAAGTPSGGAAGSSAGGAAGSTGGAAGSVTGGSAGTPSGGAAGAGGNGGAGDGGTGGTQVDASTDAPVSTICGDGIRDPLTEECDDGNASSSDSCSACFVQDVLLVPGPGSDGGVPPKVSRRMGDGRHPAAGGDSGFAVAFVTSLPAPVTLGLLRFDAVGVPASAPLSVAADASVTPGANPVVAALPGGKYAVAYTDLNADGDGLGVALRLIDSGAGPLVRANTTKTFGQHDVDLVWTGTELVAAWVDDSKLPISGSDVRMRRFSASLTPLSSEEVVANSPAQESAVALAPFASSWAAAWRSATSGAETIVVKAVGASWSVPLASPGPAEDKPALTELDATHLLLVFSEGTPARLRGAILDTASQGTVTSIFPIAPSVAPYSTDASLAQSHPNAIRAGSRLFVAWRSSLVPGDTKAEELWLKELAWTSSTLDLSKAEIALPRWPSHLKDDQRRAALAAMGTGALATAWDDYGRVFGSVEGTPDVVAELIPLPILRKNLPDGGAQ
ncbi:MAG: DUF4215 domain-containing protein [Myxococcales bacterium]|nr:DUF4215 domain-containing protein [Myxococcales bacterium]